MYLIRDDMETSDERHIQKRYEEHITNIELCKYYSQVGVGGSICFTT